MTTAYTQLAALYDQLRLGQFAQTMTPRLLDYAQRNDWMGRRILDIGTGTGRGLEYLAQHGYVVTALDRSPAMLQQARKRFDTSSLTIRWLEQDLSTLDNLSNIDMALALSVFNEQESLRDLEHSFNVVHNCLADDKLFIFDMYTIAGLADLASQGQRFEYESASASVFIEQSFDYERSQYTGRRVIFQQDENDDRFIRFESQQVLRAFPIQALLSLLQRCNYTVQTVLNTDLSPYQPGKEQSPRVIIMAQKR